MLTVVTLNGKIQGETSFYGGEKSLKSAIIICKGATARSLGHFFTKDPHCSTVTWWTSCSAVCALVLLTVSWWSDSDRLALNNRIYKWSCVCAIVCVCVRAAAHLPRECFALL